MSVLYLSNLLVKPLGEDFQPGAERVKHDNCENGKSAVVIGTNSKHMQGKGQFLGVLLLASTRCCFCLSAKERFVTTQLA